MIITADWILPIATPPLPNGYVAVERGRITALGQQENLPAKALAADILALPGMAVLPGLVNLHTHLDYSRVTGLPDGLPFFEWIIELIKAVRRWKPEEWLESARHGAGEMLRSGVTCLADSGYSGAAVQAMKEAGLRGVAGCELFGRHEEQAPGRLLDLQERVQDLNGRSSRLTRVGIALHTPYTVAPGLWRAAVMWAEKERLSVQCHLAESLAETEAIARGEGAIGSFLKFLGQDTLSWPIRGLSPVAHVAAFGGLTTGMLAAHCVQVSDEDIQLLKDAGVAVAHCPRSNARLGCGRAPLERIRDASVAWGLGTDSTASGSPLSMWEEMRFALGVHRAARSDFLLTAGDLLRQVTLEAARILDWDEEIGSLEVGKAADLVAVPLPGIRDQGSGIRKEGPEGHDICSQIVYTVQEAALVMIDGEIVYQRGQGGNAFPSSLL